MIINDLNLKELKVGDNFHEISYGCKDCYTVIEEPKKEITESGDTFWSWIGKDCDTGVEIDFGATEEYSHYAPDVYLGW